jgi:hypothetical protein
MFSRSSCSPLCADRAITHSTVSRNRTTVCAS